MEQHHPIIDKLGDIGGRTYRHRPAVRQIAKYFTSTSTYIYLSDGTRRLSTCGVLYKPDKEKGIGCYADVNFSDGWDQSDVDHVENFISLKG